MDSIRLKSCSKCKQSKPLSAFYKDRTRTDGYEYVCKDCRTPGNSARSRAYQLAHPEKARAHAQRYRLQHLEEVRQKVNRYHSQHRERLRAYWRKWHQEHREYKSAYRRENRDHFREIERNQRKANPAIARAKGHRRRARLLAAGGTFTAQEWNDLKAQYGYRCLCCGRQEPEIVLTVDHVVPISLGGHNDISNIQPLCLSCNTSKGNRHITDYRLTN